MKSLILFCLAIIGVGCSSASIVGQSDDDRKQVIDNWQNISLYFSPPPNYQVIGLVTGKGKGLGDQSKMEKALQAIKEKALDAGATGILLSSAGMSEAGSVNTANFQSAGNAVYGLGVSVPITEGTVSGQAIYVPEDAARFQKAQKVYQSKCDDLSDQKDEKKAADKAAKKAGNRADIDAADKALQAVEDEQDAEYCGDNDWYAKQMQSTQQLMDKMRAEDQASKDAVNAKAKEDHDAQCLKAAKDNDLAAWQKLGCQ